jgi:hypothetical protein
VPPRWQTDPSIVHRKRAAEMLDVELAESVGDTGDLSAEICPADGVVTGPRVMDESYLT